MKFFKDVKLIKSIVLKITIEIRLGSDSFNLAFFGSDYMICDFDPKMDLVFFKLIFEFLTTLRRLIN